LHFDTCSVSDVRAHNGILLKDSSKCGSIPCEVLMRKAMCTQTVARCGQVLTDHNNESYNSTMHAPLATGSPNISYLYVF